MQDINNYDHIPFIDRTLVVGFAVFLQCTLFFVSFEYYTLLNKINIFINLNVFRIASRWLPIWDIVLPLKRLDLLQEIYCQEPFF